MPERIGLVATLDLRQFNRNVTTYLSKINQMQTATVNMARAVSSSLTVVTNNITNLSGQATNYVTLLRSQIQQLQRVLSSTSALTGYKNQLQGLTQAANQAANSLANLGRAGSGARGGLSGIGGGLGGIGGGAGNILGGLGSIGGAVGNVVGGIAGSLASVVKSVTGLVGSVIRSFSGMASSIFRIVGSIATTVGIAFNTILRTVLKIVGNIVSGVISAFTTILNTVMRIVGSIVSGVIGAFNTILRSVISIAGSIVSGIVTAFSTVFRSVISIVGNLVSGIVKAFTSLLGAVLGIVQSIVGGIVNAFSSLVGMVANAISGIASAIVGAFSGVLRAVGSVVSSIANTVIGIFSGMVKAVVSLIEGMVKTVFSAISNLVRKVGDTLRSIATSILDAYRDLGAKLVQVLAVSTAAVTGALALFTNEIKKFFSAAISEAAEFQQNMADIQAVLRLTANEVRPLGDLIDSLALDPQLVVSTSEASAVIEQLARNGLKMSEILDGAAESAILLANATGGEMAVAADVATMAMQMFGLSASEVNRIADVSQGVINNSRINLDDWALALGNGGAAAASFGVTFEEFATVIAGSVNLFHSARQAGTGAMNFFQRLVPVTERSADALRQAGLYTGLTSDELAKMAEEAAETEKRIADLDPRMVHYDELVEAHTQHLAELRQQMVMGNSAFFDSQGNFEGSKTVAVELAKAMKDLSIEQRRAFSDAVFGNDAYETFLGMVQMGEKELAGLEGSFSNITNEIVIQNSAMEAAVVRTETLQARWRNLGDIWEAIRRKSGEKFTDMLYNLVERLTTLTNLNQDRIISFFGRMADLINKIVDAAIPWVESQLPAIINNLEALASWLVETVLQGDKAQYWFDKMSPGLRNFMERVFATVRAVKEFAGQVMDLVGSLSRAFRPFIEFMLQNVQLKDVLIAAAGAILFNIVPGILRLVGVSVLAVKAVASIRKAWEEDWGGIRSFLEEVWPKIRQPLTDFINNFLTGKWEKAWENMVSVVSTVLQDLEDAVPDFFKDFVNLMNDVLHGDWEGAWQNVVKISQKSFDLIKKYLRDLEHPISDFITDVLEGNWPKVWEKISNTARDSFNLIVYYLRKLEGPVSEFINKVLKKAWKRAWDDIQLETEKSLNKIVAGLYAMDTPLSIFTANILTGRWQEAWDQIKAGASFAYQWVITELYKLDSPYSAFLADVLSGNWAVVWQKIKDGATSAYQWVITELYAIESPYTDFIANILSGEWYKAWQQARQVVVDAFNGVIEALDSLNNPITEFIVDVIRGRWFEAWEDFKVIAGIAFDAVKFMLKELNLPFTNFILNVLEGEWSTAWKKVSNVAITAFEIIKKALSDFNTPFTDFLVNILEGNWQRVWNTIQTIALNTLEKIKEYVPGWGDSFVSSIQSIIQGKWGEAWTHARQGTVDILNELKNLTPEWFDPFVTSIQQLLNGEWKGAWETAVNGVNVILATLATYLPGWAQPFVGAIQAMLDGDFARAWNNALHGINLTLDKIKENVPTWMGNAITLLQQILSGEWSSAWGTAKQIALDALQPIRDWVDVQGKVLYEWFKTNMPESTLATETGFANIKVAWDRFVEAITDSETQGNIDHLGSIVIGGLTKLIEGLLLGATAIVHFFNGDWKKGWEVAGEAVSTFGELPALNTITTWFNENFPDAVDSFNENMPEIQSAWDPVASQWSTTWGIIQTWWNTDVKAFFAKTFTSVSDYVSTTIAQFGILTQAILTLFTGEGSITDRISQALEKSKEISKLEMEFWTRDLERSTVDLSALALKVGSAVNKGVNEGVLEETIMGPEGFPVPKGLVYWTAGVEGAMTRLQQEIYNRAKLIGEQTNYGYVAGLGDPSQPIVEGLNAWTELAISTAEDGLEIKSPSQKFKKIAQYTMEGFRDGILQNMNITFDAAGQMTVSFLEKFNIILSNLPDIARRSLIGFVDAFRESMGQALDLAVYFVKALSDRLNPIRDIGRGIGENLAQSLADGMKGQLTAVQDAAAQLAAAAQTGVKTEAQIASPSKVFKRLGEFMREGLIIGFNGDNNWVNSLVSAGSVAQQTASSFGDFARTLNTANYSYNNTYNSPVQIGPNYIYTRMDDAEFEYKVKNIVSGMRD